jgi:hypothetical protein
VSMRLRTSIILITLFFGTIFALYAQAQSDVVIPDSVFVRSGPSDEYAIVGSLFAGDAIRPLSISPDREWLLIRSGRGFGWIRRNLVELTTDVDVLPVLPPNVTPTPDRPPTATPFFPTATPSTNYVQLNGAESAFVRAGPGAPISTWVIYYRVILLNHLHVTTIHHGFSFAIKIKSLILMDLVGCHAI